MGFFTGLLTLPLAPVRGVSWVTDQVAQEADRQLYDEDRIRSELMQLEMDAEDGKLSEEEQRRMEDDLLERLAIAQARESDAYLEQEGMEWEPVPEEEERTDG